MIYDSNPVPVIYTHDEMKQVIDEYLKDVTTEFSFRSLCSYIIDRAIMERKVHNASGTQYSSRQMNPMSAVEVSKYLWELIWDKKIFIAFGENPYTDHYNGDTRFIINN